PVNLLGRDLLIALGATILCGPDGLIVTFPDGSSHACSQVYTHGQFLLQQTEERLADIYWGLLQPETTDHAGILSCFLLWKPWIQALAPYGPAPDLPHVTLFYDQDQTEWYQEQFEAHLAGSDWTVLSQDIYVA
uniref:Peptidase A2 domain-containing protein n=1 Tax=Poecilia formosa TaxID=48698 RepID=A0A096MEB6_POEFO